MTRAEVKIIGILPIPDGELRFVRQPGGGWEADLVVNTNAGTVSKPPPCFIPDERVIAALDAAVDALIAEEDDALDRRFTNERVHGPGCLGDTAADTAERERREART